MAVLLIQILTEEDDNLFTYIGINAIAGYLEKNNVSHKIFKGQIHEILNKINNYLDPHNTQIIGINIMTPRYKESMDFIYKLRTLKNFNSNSYIIAGGPHFTLMPKLLPQEIDCAVIGDGEETFLELITTPKNKWGTIKGIAYHSGKNILLTKPRELINLDFLPFPEYECAKYKINGDSYFVSSISTSRGCPYKCIYSLMG